MGEEVFLFIQDNKILGRNGKEVILLQDINSYTSVYKIKRCEVRVLNYKS